MPGIRPILSGASMAKKSAPHDGSHEGPSPSEFWRFAHGQCRRCGLRLEDIPYMTPKARHARCDRAGEGGSPSNSAGDRGGVGQGHGSSRRALPWCLPDREACSPRSIELEVTADGEGGEATPADQPEAEEGQDEPITILELSSLVAGAGKLSASSISSMPKSRICQGGTSRSKRSSGCARAARRP